MYYRNITDIITDQNIEIEAGSLWKLDEETFIMTLVDDDQHITAKHVTEVFQFALYEYAFEFLKPTEFPIVLKALREDLTAFSLTGNQSSDVLKFQFKTLLSFTEVFSKLAKLPISKIELSIKQV